MVQRLAIAWVKGTQNSLAMSPIKTFHPAGLKAGALKSYPVKLAAWLFLSVYLKRSSRPT